MVTSLSVFSPSGVQERDGLNDLGTDSTDYLDHPRHMRWYHLDRRSIEGKEVMEVALIPPVNYMGFTHQTGMQLVLPELLHNREYREVVEEHLSNPNQYVILDNGAAEAKQPANDELVAIVEDLYPQEFALPDFLGNPHLTCAKAFEFLDKYGELFEDLPTRLGLVTQGKNAFEATWMVHKVLESPYGHLIKTLYIPRLLVKATSDPLIRVKLANHFKKAYPHLDIHLFGASPMAPKEALYASMVPSIRSIDTSLPFVAGFHEVSIRLVKSVPDRPQHYFKAVFNETQLELVHDNVACYLSWVGGYNG